MSPGDIIWKAKQNIWQEWQSIYLEITEEKGKYFRNLINGNLQKQPWYKKVRIKATYIKVINRLKTGHSFDDKFLKMIKIINNDTCEICQCTGTAEHIILQCNKYENTRRKYNKLNNNSLTNILKSEDGETYLQICKFLEEIQKYL